MTNPLLYIQAVLFQTIQFSISTVFLLHIVKYGNYTRMLRAILNNPGSNTPQDTNCTATCPLSRKLFKLDEPEMQDTAGEAEMNS